MNPCSELIGRFWERVSPEPNTGCWLWVGGATARDYGTLGMPGSRKRVYAHRLSYEIHVGPIPEGLVIDHLCRQHRCCNPEHLEAVTQRENLRRGVGFPGKNARKTHCVNGHPLSGENLNKKKGRNGEYNRQCWTCQRAQNRKVSERRKRARRAKRLRSIAENG